MCLNGTITKNMTSLKDREKFVPAFDSPERKSSMFVATFNLVASIVGAGVLSLPLAFQKAGVIPATFMMVFAAIVTDFALYLLCSCARRTGASSFGEVFLFAFGKKFERGVTLFLFIFLLFVHTAYYVLVRSVWTPIFDDLFLSKALSFIDDRQRGDIVLFCILLSMFPFLLMKDLHALRYNCYIGFTSISVLCMAMVYRAMQKCALDQPQQQQPLDNRDDILWVSHSPADLLYAFPFIMLSFLATFNVIEVQGALVNPTRKRVRFLIDASVVSCLFLTYAFGLAGYLFARSETKGNILLNFPVGDSLIILGRLGSGMTLVMALPIIHMPCRKAILEFLPFAVQWWKGQNTTTTTNIVEPSDVEQQIVPPDERSSLLLRKMSTDTDATILHSNQVSSSSESDKDTRARSIATLCIVTSCYLLAVFTPGVAVVWSICGSSMAFLIAFILPCWAYIKLRQLHLGWSNIRILGAWSLMILSILLATACTIQTVIRLFF